MIGQIISHYKILEKLGEGGMGIVYRAQDTKLDRIVALKFLPPQVSTTEQDKTRFTQEARAAAALNHPNICHIYRIDEVDAPPASGRAGEKLMFIEMEHVDGVTLRKKIAAGPVPMAEALTLATQIGEGLEEAHGKGIIHRDIKSDNVMVNSRGQAKVMDFGLAKLKGALKLTRSSSTVGTLAYMAPEQLRGVEADARSDIFSFGVLFYEMLTGRVPFEGAHEAALMYSITNEPPIPLEKYIPDAPAELLHIINRSLEKDPEDRYQTVHDMIIDIRRMRKDSTRVSQRAIPRMDATAPGPATTDSGVTRVSGFIQPPIEPIAPLPPVPPGASGPVPLATPQPARRSSSVTIQIPTGGRSWMMIAAIVVAIGLAVAGYLRFGGSDDGGQKLSVAVADFQNQTNEAELDGLSGMLTTAMEQSKKLSVVTRSHMFDILKQMGKADVEKIDESVGKEICSKAGIGALVTASIRKLGKLYIIDLKVVDPTKNDYLFTAKEEGEGQESIPRMLDNLSEKTRAGLKEKTDEIRNSNADLAVVTTTNMEAYQHYFKGEEFLNKLDMEKAEAEFRKAVQLDSLFGLAWYRLAYTLSWIRVRENDALPKALALIDRIPDKERYLLRGIAADRGQGYGEAIAILKEMEQRYPNDKEMLYNIGDWSYHDRDYATAIGYLTRTLALDPTHERALQHLTWTYRETGQNALMRDAARRYVDAAFSKESFDLLTEAYKALGEYGEGIREFNTLRSAHPGMAFITRDIAEFQILSGDKGAARAELEALIAAGDSASMAEGVQGLQNLFILTGRYASSIDLMRKSVSRSLARGDTVIAANNLVGMGWINFQVAGSKDRAGKNLQEFDRLALPKSADAWIVRTILGILIDPGKDIDPEIARTPFLKTFIGMFVLCGRGSCQEASQRADTLLRGGFQDDFRLFVRYWVANCFYRAGRYNDALSAINAGLSYRSVTGSGNYPPALVLQGNIQEAMGNRNDALATYGKFLTLWKDADADLAILVDVKKRVAALKAVSAN